MSRNTHEHHRASLTLPDIPRAGLIRVRRTPAARSGKLALIVALSFGLATHLLYAMEYSVPLFLSTSDSSIQGFVRVVNRSSVDGTVVIRVIDDSGWQAPDITLSVKARHSRHFNSFDLESGNPEKGLVGSAGPPVQGD